MKLYWQHNEDAHNTQNTRTEGQQLHFSHRQTVIQHYMIKTLVDVILNTVRGDINNKKILQAQLIAWTWVLSLLGLVVLTRADFLKRTLLSSKCVETVSLWKSSSSEDD